MCIRDRIYTLPTFQNPSGAVLSMGRRLRLLDLAARYQIPIVEDDPYGALRYDGRTLPTLSAIDQAEGCLLYTSPSPRDRTRSRMPSSA